jgi:hypothetical protein
MSSLEGPGTGGEGAPEKRRPGRPKGREKKAESPVATPLVSRKRGRPLGSRNLKTLAALAAVAATVPAVAASVGAAPAVAASVGAVPAVGGVDVPRKRGPGRPKGSKKKTAMVAAVAPSPWTAAGQQEQENSCSLRGHCL